MIEPSELREAALAVEGVLAMHPGPFGTAATYGARGRVWGLRVATGRVDVHIVAAIGHDLRRLGERVRAAVRAHLGDYPGVVAVHVEDLAETAPAEPQIHTGATPVARSPLPRRTP